MAKRSQSERSPTNVNEVIDKVLSLTRGETGVWDVAVRTELETGIPSVIADRIQLQQVLLNLIMNAIEAMAASQSRSRRLEISTHLQQEGWVSVSVRDSGTGFESDATQRIFEGRPPRASAAGSSKFSMRPRLRNFASVLIRRCSPSSSICCRHRSAHN